jgi:EAL domain-containing protein (putative c-di-GMP-specific phosphodiesterase class I)
MSKNPNHGTAWFLEGYVGDQQILRRFRVEPLPFRVGRALNLPLTINSANLSRLHAEIEIEDGRLFVRDLGSTNGTFVNQKRIAKPTPINEGDIVHFGTSEFRVGCEQLQSADLYLETLSFEGSLPAQFLTGAPEFLELLEQRSVIPFFQPIITFEDSQTIGFEVLGRGNREDISSLPGELFAIATSLGLEVRLSELFREKGADIGQGLPGSPCLFLNLHPSEMKRPDLLIQSLEIIRTKYPDASLALEVHEALFTDLQMMRELRNALDDLQIGLAYDDFGAGQARLMELAEVPPDVLKFDMSLIQKLEQATKARRQMIAVLVKYAMDVGVVCLAEGIETEAERAACIELGFQLGQGYYFSHPAPVSAFSGTTTV